MSEWKIHLTPGVRLVDCDPIERALWSRHRTQGGTMNDEVLADIGRILDLVDRGGGREHPPAACSLCRGDMEALRRLRDLVTPPAEPPSRNEWQRAVVEGHTIDSLDGWIAFEMRCRALDPVSEERRVIYDGPGPIGGHMIYSEPAAWHAEPTIDDAISREDPTPWAVRRTHRCPREGESVMPCCGIPPGERMGDRMTIDDANVTCRQHVASPRVATAENPGPFGRSEDYPL